MSTRFDFSRDAENNRTMRSKEKEENRTSARTRSNEVIILNDYDVYGCLNQMKFFVNPTDFDNFLIKAGEIELHMKCAIDDLRSTIKYGSKSYRLGKPSKAYKAFLKKRRAVDLELPVIYNCSIWNISTDKKYQLNYKLIGNEEVAVIGTVFNHDRLPDGRTIVSGNIGEAEKVTVSGIEVIKITTVEEVEYFVLEDEYTLNCETDEIFTEVI